MSTTTNNSNPYYAMILMCLIIILTLFTCNKTRAEKTKILYTNSEKMK
jgi:hypothetical protein